MNILICDDDKKDMDRLQKLIDQYDEEHHIEPKIMQKVTLHYSDSSSAA